jgi:hypothetical protein
VPINRRALLGAGVLGASIAGTVGVSLLRDDPVTTPVRRARSRLDGMAADPMRALLQDAAVIEALRRRGVRLDDIDRADLGGDPDDLDEGEYVFAALDSLLIEDGGSRTPLFTSPLVLQARPATAQALADAGLTTAENGRAFVDAAALLASTAPFALGDPERSDTAYLLTALTVALLGGDRTAPLLRPRLKPDDSFEAFMSVDPAAAPARVGSESEFPAWIAADSNRWSQLQASRPDAAPVTLYLRPTLYATWTLYTLDARARPLAAALQTEELQELGRLRHGLRGPQRQSVAGESFQAAARLPPPPTEVAPLPDSAVIRQVIETLTD